MCQRPARSSASVITCHRWPLRLLGLHRWGKIDTTGIVIGVAVGIPAAIATGAVLALTRGVFRQTNAALVLMIVVVVVAAIGGRAAGMITALAAVLSFDFFHTRPYLSLTIDSRDDIETTILLLVAGIIVGTVASSGRRGASKRPMPAQRYAASTTSPRWRRAAPTPPPSLVPPRTNYVLCSRSAKAASKQCRSRTVSAVRSCPETVRSNHIK